MTELTARQADILDYFRSFLRKHGYAPTIREIGLKFGISLHGVEGHLTALERKGRLTPSKGKSRVRMPVADGKCPVCGGVLSEGTT